MNKALTIKDIAEIAGVAKSTVSRYLNNGKVSEETKEKIRRVIEEHNYEPNAFAQSLKAKKNKICWNHSPWVRFYCYIKSNYGH